MRPLLIALVIPVLGIAGLNCAGGSGTGVGNPKITVRILDSVCTVLSACSPDLQYGSCRTAVQATGGLGSALGLPAGDYTFSSIEAQESSGAATANPTAADACTSTIQGLGCGTASVAGAYVPTNASPFAGVANMLPAQSCGQVFAPASGGTNLEVPIEMTGNGLSSSAIRTTFSRTRTTLNTADYDGIVTYAFEVVAANSDSAPRNVALVDSSGATVASIVIPVSANPVRYRSTFVATSGAADYRIALDGTSSAQQLRVWVGRMLVQQIGATQTRIFVPLMVGNNYVTIPGDDSSASLSDTDLTTYSQPNANWWALWKKNDSAFSQLAPTSAWTFEAVMSNDAGSTAYASVFDAVTGNQVQASEVSTAATTPTLVSAAFADSAPNFTDQDNMEVQMKGSTGGGGKNAYIYRAGLWIKLVNLSHAEVYYRINDSDSWAGTGGTPQPRPEYRILPDISAFNQPVSIYNELTSYVSSPGTSCTEALYDNGTSDSSASGSVVPGSALTVSSTALNRQRSPAVSVSAGNRFTSFITPTGGSGNCRMVSTFFVIGF
jgi:hypothetical protein